MKTLVAILALVVAVGCSSPARKLREMEAEINQAAFEGKITSTIHLCHPHDPACVSHHGYFYPQANDIHIAWQWEFEPALYLRGAVAHEMIHAYLFLTGYRSLDSKPHDWKFQAERERVAAALDLPLWAIPNGRRIDKLDASLDLAYLEAFLAAGRVAAGLNPATGDWPSTIYDVDTLEGEP